MKHKYEIVSALLCMLLIVALLFIVAMRVGALDQRELWEQDMEDMKQSYENQIAALEMQLAAEREIENIVHYEEYVPMAVDYAVVEEPDPTEITMLAQAAWGEDRGIDTRPEAVAAVIYTILNRVDDPRYPNTIPEVITQQGQYHGYYSTNPVDYRYYNLALDCYYRWQIKRLGVSDPGYTVPYNCLNFSGWGGENHFKAEGVEVEVEEGVYG